MKAGELFQATPPSGQRLKNSSPQGTFLTHGTKSLSMPEACARRAGTECAILPSKVTLNRPR